MIDFFTKSTIFLRVNDDPGFLIAVHFHRPIFRKVVICLDDSDNQAVAVKTLNHRSGNAIPYIPTLLVGLHCKFPVAVRAYTGSVVPYPGQFDFLTAGTA